MPQDKTSHMQFGSRTDVGSVRERNEDSLAVNPPLFVVADGMGGHKAGDVASEVAVNTVQALAPTTPDIDLLGRAVEAANHAVITESQKAGRDGMGTTMTACIVKGEQLALAHVGDSRAYLLHAGKLQQITRDHSWVADMVEQGRLTPQEARVHPNRSVITRALGSDPFMKPDLYEITASEGDRLLLCSDGLCSMVEDGDIQSVLARVRDPQQCAAALVKEAIAAGGSDNVTVIVVDIAGDGTRRLKQEKRRGRAWVAILLSLLALVIAGSVFGVYSLMHNSAYLAEEKGVIVIYQGIPEEFPGIETHWLYRTTDVDIEALPPTAQSHIREGMRVDNIEAAEKLVADYERQIEEDKALEMEKGKSSSSSSSTASSSSSSTASSSSSASSAESGGEGASSSSASSSPSSGDAASSSEEAGDE